MTDLSVLRELFNARFDALEAKMTSWVAVFEKEIGRQDETIERLADRTTHSSETKRLTERVIKLEAQIEVGRTQLNDLHFRVKVTWAIGGMAATIILAVLIAIIEKWIGA